MMKNILSELDKIVFKFQESANCVFLLIDGEAYTDGQIKEVMDISGGHCKRAEEDCNRFFIYRDYLNEFFAGEKIEESVIIDVAKNYERLLRCALEKQFPDKKFITEVIGENLVDEEPLEVCVTFTSVN